MANILVVEDEFDINRLICKNLTLTGHKCKSAYDGIEALKIINDEKPELIILDVMLPGLTGFELIEYAGNIPVIFVTARAGLEDKLKGLKLGADDYIVKPFEMQELLARVSTVLRRVKRENTVFSFDDITIDFDKRFVCRDGVEIKLTPKEYDLLETLILNRNIALTRDRLLNLVWNIDFDGDTRTVDIHIQQLRKKLGLKNRIVSLYKIGYRFEL
ncbi:MAG: response regulator transcription factor [Clostridia bacterium]|nr:response regulator transcription factor [Clostridia bacterium]